MRSFILITLLPLFLYGYSYRNSQTRDTRHNNLQEFTLKPTSKKSHQYLFGDMGGLRPAFSRKGITFTTDYLQYIITDPIGEERKALHTEALVFDFNWDFEKGCNVKGFSFHFGMGIASGQNLDVQVGNAFPLTPLIRGRTFVVSNIYFKQRAYDDRFVFKFGRIQAGDDFLTSPLLLKFMNQAFSFQMPIYTNAPMSAAPYAVWGAFCEAPLHKNLALKLGVYAADADAYQNKYHGLDMRWNKKAGAQLIEELSYSLTSLSHPGTYTFGAFYLTGTQPRYFSTKSQGNFGLYFLFTQKVSGSHPSRGLSLFASSLFFPKDRNPFPFFFSLGGVYKGLFPARPKDATVLGFARGSYSSNLRALQQRAQNSGLPGLYGNQLQNFEAVFECNHEFYITPWFNLTPTFEYIIKPSGLDLKNALVVALQASTYF